MTETLEERVARAMAPSFHTYRRYDGDEVQDQPTCLESDEIPERGRLDGWCEYLDGGYLIHTMVTPWQPR